VFDVSCDRTGWACPDKLVLQVGNNPFLYEVDFKFEEDVWYHVGIVQVKQIFVRSFPPPHSFPTLQRGFCRTFDSLSCVNQATTIKVYINGALIQNMQVTSAPPIHGNISLTFGTLPVSSSA
jgi:hypothetical protein